MSLTEEENSESWIGARKELKNGLYVQLGDAPSFDDNSPMWKHGRPNDHDKDDRCVLLKNKDEGLDDKKCDDEKEFTCILDQNDNK